jgi:hypothetical protein
VKVRIVKSGDAAPMRLVKADDPQDAAAVRELDLQKKFHRSAAELAEALSLTGPRAVALRRALKIDQDPDCAHTFTFGSQKHLRFSDNAFTKMRAELETADMDEIWAKHGPKRGSRKTSSDEPSAA